MADLEQQRLIAFLDTKNEDESCIAPLNQATQQHVPSNGGAGNTSAAKIFDDDNPIDILLELLHQHPQIDAYIQSNGYHHNATTSATSAVEYLTLIMNSQPQLKQTIKSIQQQLKQRTNIPQKSKQKRKRKSKKRNLNEMSNANHSMPKNKRQKISCLSSLISPAPIHWKIVSCLDESDDATGKWKIKLKVIKNPLKDALKRIWHKPFDLDEMLDILAEDKNNINRTETAKKRLKEELLFIRGCYQVRNVGTGVDQFNASDFVNSFSDDLCYKCNKFGGVVMLCDGCPHVFHIYCVGLKRVPVDKWFCNQCVVNGDSDGVGDGGSVYLTENNMCILLMEEVHIVDGKVDYYPDLEERWHRYEHDSEGESDTWSDKWTLYPTRGYGYKPIVYSQANPLNW